jgi:tRNA(Ile)-lysidine synthase
MGKPQGRLNLPNGVLVKKSYETLLFMKNKDERENAENGGFHYLLGTPGVFNLDAIPCAVTMEEIKAEEISQMDSSSPWVACFDAARIEYPLIVRNFLPGDRFVPLGMTGHKKVKDFFVDRKIPSDTRKRLPLLCRGKDPIWVCGLRIDNRFKVRPETEKVVRVSLSFPAETLISPHSGWS